MSVVIGIFFGILGLIIGSFLNVCIYRIPEDKSIAFPPSACIACGHRLSWKDLFPVFSYVFLKGKCRYCGKKISVLYPVVELLTAALFVLLYGCYGLSLSLLIYLATVCLLIVASFIDLEHKIIPDGIVIALAIVGAVSVLLDLPDWLDHLYGVLAGGLPLLLIALIGQWVFKKEAMGGGDVKLMAAAGLILGWKLALFSLFFGIVAGALFFTVLLASKKAKGSDLVPFGPFLSIGILGAVLFGNSIINWYLSLLIR